MFTTLVGNILHGAVSFDCIVAIAELRVLLELEVGLLAWEAIIPWLLVCRANCDRSRRAHFNLLRSLTGVVEVVVEVADVGVQMLPMLVAIILHPVLGVFGLECRRHRRLRKVLILSFPLIRQYKMITRAVFLH